MSLFSGHIKVMSTIASHSPLNISEIVRDRDLVGNGLRGMKWSRDRWRHAISKGQTRYPNTLRAQRNVSKTAGDAI